MINAKELRLGNIVSYKGVIGKVTWIQQDCITIEYQRQNDLSNGSMVSPESLDGVKLTEKRLLKCGFIYNDKYEFPAFDELIHSDFKWFGIGDFNNKYFIIDFIDQVNTNHHIKYLHQLQNLFQALSQKELDTTKIFD